MNTRLFAYLAAMGIAGATALSVRAADGTWNWFTEGYTNGLSPEAIADWNDTANWVEGVVPDGENPTAYLVPSDRTSSMASFPARWIKVPDAGITLGYLSTRQAAKVYLLGGHTLTASVASNGLWTLNVPSVTAGTLAFDLAKGDAYPGKKVMAWEAGTRPSDVLFTHAMAVPTVSLRRAMASTSFQAGSW